jgi:hypothetical protein
MPDRRYDDDEVAAIFQKAAEGQETLPRHAPQGVGLTLADLQEIGREVGIAPEAVAQAAQSMDLGGRAVSQTLFGLPFRVERTVALDRNLTEEEWGHLVVQLREVFNARGTVSASGSLRQWTNGNLQALLEPTATGYRLRLRTVKGSARTSMAAGFAVLGVAAAVAISAATAGQLGHAVPGIALLSVLGLGMWGNSALRLPAWASRRQRQMEIVAADLVRLTGPKLPNPET